MRKTGRLRGRMDHRDMVGGWRSPLQRATTSPGSYATLLESRTTLRWWCVNLWLFVVTLHCVAQLWHQGWSRHVHYISQLSWVAPWWLAAMLNLSPCFRKQVKLEHHVGFRKNLKRSKNDSAGACSCELEKWPTFKWFVCQSRPHPTVQQP